MSRTVFITGTDTGVGKSHVACALLRAARAAGIDAVGYKPVASGCEQTPDGWRNADALALQSAGAFEPYECINPVALPEAIAPHLAARAQGLRIDTQQLGAGHAALAARHELVIVEGAGGWRVPLNDEQELADWVSAQRWPVLLVVGLRLGCINHALLSAESIAARAPLLGWIGNALPPLQQNWQDNLDSLRQRMPAACLGTFAPGSMATMPILQAVLDALRRP
ncbi:dethiobiotin synthetase [Solimonas aquatica]|uniref:ATP-dependent dethiobiotin synthetase BioD n=1 Tax=Solimonas aquatica TaxID=489703 RepID=A0A1H9BQA4_9GAMM|nr:dethiobiotin synthase [Solimonas aquatica]SEP91126.1 dethiobiotin synthetase [Solimonas aquatica]